MSAQLFGKNEWHNKFLFEASPQAGCYLDSGGSRLFRFINLKTFLLIKIYLRALLKLGGT